MPRKPPSEEASATFWPIACNQALNPAASWGALSIEDSGHFSQISERTLNSVSRLSGAGKVLTQCFLNG